MKRQITISEILKEEGITLSDLSEKLGIKISLLSKIKNSNNPITKYTRDKFNKVYPNYELVNGSIYWKDLYQEQVNINYKLKEENKKLKQDNKEILKAIRYFYAKYEKE